jgi:GxxExxY protein
MPYEDEVPPWEELDAATTELTHRIIGAAIAVHRALGPGLDEQLYENALVVELTAQGIRFNRQVVVQVAYRGRSVGERRIDFIVDDRIVVELKAVEALAPLHKAQVLTYLKITGLRVRLLINFNTHLLKDGISRILNPTGR